MKPFLTSGGEVFTLFRVLVFAAVLCGLAQVSPHVVLAAEDWDGHVHQRLQSPERQQAVERAALQDARMREEKAVREALAAEEQAAAKAKEAQNAQAAASASETPGVASPASRTAGSGDAAAPQATIPASPPATPPKPVVVTPSTAFSPPPAELKPESAKPAQSAAKPAPRREGAKQAKASGPTTRTYIPQPPPKQAAAPMTPPLPPEEPRKSSGGPAPSLKPTADEAGPALLAPVPPLLTPPKDPTPTAPPMKAQAPVSPSVTKTAVPAVKTPAPAARASAPPSKAARAPEASTAGRKATAPAQSGKTPSPADPQVEKQESLYREIFSAEPRQTRRGQAGGRTSAQGAAAKKRVVYSLEASPARIAAGEAADVTFTLLRDGKAAGRGVSLRFTADPNYPNLRTAARRTGPGGKLTLKGLEARLPGDFPLLATVAGQVIACPMTVTQGATPVEEAPSVSEEKAEAAAPDAARSGTPPVAAPPGLAVEASSPPDEGGAKPQSPLEAADQNEPAEARAAAPEKAPTVVADDQDPPLLPVSVAGFTLEADPATLTEGEPATVTFTVKRKGRRVGKGVTVRFTASERFPNLRTGVRRTDAGGRIVVRGLLARGVGQAPLRAVVAGRPNLVCPLTVVPGTESGIGIETGAEAAGETAMPPPALNATLAPVEIAPAPGQ